MHQVVIPAPELTSYHNADFKHEVAFGYVPLDTICPPNISVHLPSKVEGLTGFKESKYGYTPIVKKFISINDINKIIDNYRQKRRIVDEKNQLKPNAFSTKEKLCNHLYLVKNSDDLSELLKQYTKDEIIDAIAQENHFETYKKFSLFVLAKHIPDVEKLIKQKVKLDFPLFLYLLTEPLTQQQLKLAISLLTNTRDIALSLTYFNQHVKPLTRSQVAAIPDRHIQYPRFCHHLSKLLDVLTDSQKTILLNKMPSNIFEYSKHLPLMTKTKIIQAFNEVKDDSYTSINLAHKMLIENYPIPPTIEKTLKRHLSNVSKDPERIANKAFSDIFAYVYQKTNPDIFSAGVMINTLGLTYHQAKSVGSNKQICKVLLGTHHKQEVDFLLRFKHQFLWLYPSIKGFFTNNKKKVDRFSLLRCLADINHATNESQINELHFPHRFSSQQLLTSMDILHKAGANVTLSQLITSREAADSIISLSALADSDTLLKNAIKRIKKLASTTDQELFFSLLHNYATSKNKQSKTINFPVQREETTISGHTIIFANTNKELSQFGRVMRHCVGTQSYQNLAKKGEVFALIHEECSKLSSGVVAQFSHDNKTIRQVKGFANRAPTDIEKQICQSVSEHLKQKD